MPKEKVDPDCKSVLDSLLLNLPGVLEGKMFGSSAYYVGGKLFACIYGDGVGVKVPEEVAIKLLSEQHVVPFQPLGKPKMREWIQINRSSPADFRKDLETFHASVAFVRQIPITKRKNK